jgi:hypothetical protein
MILPTQLSDWVPCYLNSTLGGSAKDDIVNIVKLRTPRAIGCFDTAHAYRGFAGMMIQTTRNVCT